MEETKMTDVSGSMVRHPKWEKVEAGYEFQTGEPLRCEDKYGAFEHRRNFPITDPGDGYTHFRDTTWQPPVKPLKVGDLIETVEQAESLPIGTIAVTKSNVAYRKAGMNEWRKDLGAASPFADYLMVVNIDMAGYGDRIIYLPSSGSK